MSKKELALFEVKLIEEVQKRNFLYNTKALNYKNNALRVAAWRQIGERLHVSPDKCKLRWKTLRAKYRTIKITNDPTDPLNSRKAPKWMFQRYLSFLDEYLDPSLDGINSSDQQYDENVFDTEDFTSPENKNFNRYMVPKDMMEPTNDVHFMVNGKDELDITNHFLVTDREDFDLQQAQVDNEDIEMINATNGMDSVDLACLSAAKSIKRLSNRQQAIFKLKLAKLVMDIEYGTEDD